MRQTRAVLIAPFQTGVLELPPSASKTGTHTSQVVDFSAGEWWEREKLAIDAQATRIGIDEDRATCVFVLDRGSDGQWRENLKKAILKPASIEGC